VENTSLDRSQLRGVHTYDVAAGADDIRESRG
jgi:hypothetical protein